MLRVHRLSNSKKCKSFSRINVKIRMQYLRQILNPSPSERPKYRICFLPQRYIIALLLLCGVFTNSTTRVSFKIALDNTVKPTNSSVNTNESSVCRFNETKSKFVPVGKNLYDWSNYELNFINKAFFGGYVMGHFPGGYLSDRYGGKTVLSLSTVATNTLVALTPIVLTGNSMDFQILLVLRALTGFSNGMLFPSVTSILSHWVPAYDRGKLSCIVFSATQFAVVLSDTVSVSLVTFTNYWGSMLYLYSGMAILWVVFWQIFGHSTYKTNLFATQAEYAFIDAKLSYLISPEFKGIPWAKMLCSLPLWVLCIAQIGHHWIWNVLIKDLPMYMKYVLQYDLKKSYMIHAIPYFTLGIITFAIGFFVDYLINSKYVDISINRKIFTAIGAVGPAIFLVAAPYAGCSRSTTIVLFTVGMSLMSCYYAGTRINLLDLAPNYSGIITAIVHGIGSSSALVLPWVTHHFVKNNTAEEWTLLFWIHFLVLFVTCIGFATFGSGEVQSWNYHFEDESEVVEVDGDEK